MACDYITCYASQDVPVTGLGALASSLFRHQSELGNKHYGWSMSGFKGFKCGEVEVGKRNDEVLVRLHGTSAELSWRNLYERSSNVSRIDLQATILVQGGVTKAIETFRRDARRFAKARHDLPIVRWVCDHRGGYTLYLGARSSNCFGRIYDKYHHTKMEYYRDCLRAEVQYQDEFALRVAQRLYAEHSPITLMSSYISRFLERRGCRLEFSGISAAGITCPRNRSDVDRNLIWLERSVRPCIKRIMDAGRGAEALRALGLVQDE